MKVILIFLILVMGDVCVVDLEDSEIWGWRYW